LRLSLSWKKHLKEEPAKQILYREKSGERIFKREKNREKYLENLQ